MTSPRLAQLRLEIEQVDRAIIDLLVTRVRLAREVGAAKAEEGIPVLDHAREAAVVRHAVTLAREAGLPFEEEIRQLFWQVIGLSRRAQLSEG